MDSYQPIDVDTDTLDATNVPDAGFPPVFSSSSTYTVGESIRFGWRVYECLRDTVPLSDISESSSLTVSRQSYVGESGAWPRAKEQSYAPTSTYMTLHDPFTGATTLLSRPSGWEQWGRSVFSGDNSRVAVVVSSFATNNNHFAVFSVATGSLINTVLGGASGTNVVDYYGLYRPTFCLSHDGQWLAAKVMLASDASVYSCQIWDVATNTQVQSIPYTTIETAGALAFTADDEHLILATVDGDIVVVETTTWNVEATLTAKIFAAEEAYVALTDSRAAFVDQSGRYINIYDTTTWSLVQTIDGAENARFKEICYTDDGQFLLGNKLAGVAPVLYKLSGDAIVEQWEGDTLPIALNRVYDGYLSALAVNKDALTMTWQHYSIGSQPPDQLIADVVGAANAYWLDLGATNPYRMFDGVVGSYTVADEAYPPATYNAEATPSGVDRGIAVQITPAVRCDSITLLGLSGTYVDVIVQTPGESAYKKRVSIGDGRSTVTLLNIPNTTSSSVWYISVHNASGQARCGNVLIGAAQSIGSAQEGWTVEDKDYSRIIEDDDFGTVTLQQGAWSARASGNIIVELSDAPRVFDYLASVRATNCVWVPSDGEYFAPLLIYGFRRSFQVAYNHPSHVTCSIELRGLI